MYIPREGERKRGSRPGRREEITPSSRRRARELDPIDGIDLGELNANDEACELRSSSRGRKRTIITAYPAVSFARGLRARNLVKSPF